MEGESRVGQVAMGIDAATLAAILPPCGQVGLIEGAVLLHFFFTTTGGSRETERERRQTKGCSAHREVLAVDTPGCTAPSTPRPVTCHLLVRGSMGPGGDPLD
ncbi:unnamed protein product [Boreogadus saida]